MFGLGSEPVSSLAIRPRAIAAKLLISARRRAANGADATRRVGMESTTAGTRRTRDSSAGPFPGILQI